MGDGSLIENFEKCLLGLVVGDSKLFVLEFEDVFGQLNLDNIYYVDCSKFGVDIFVEVGNIIVFIQFDGIELFGFVCEV